MKCPNCSLNIESLLNNSSCPNCFYQFNQETIYNINFHNSIRSNLRNLELTQKTFSEQIDKLKDELLFFEDKVYNSDEFREKREILKNSEIAKEETKNNQVNQINEANKEIKVNKFTEKIKSVQWELLLGFNGLLILGVISVITGVGFFIRKAFVSGLLGPIGKVSIIYLGALLSLGIGNFFRKKSLAEFGTGIIGMGIALLYYSTYAGFQKYFIFNQTIAFFLMILITVFSVFMAIIENNKWLAVLGLIGGFSTPIMIDNGSGNNLVLYSYITILNIGLLSIAFNRKWSVLTNLGFIATYILYLNTFKNSEFWLSAIFVNIFFFIYSLMPIAYYIFKTNKENISNSFLIFLNSFTALCINYYLIKSNNYPIEYLSIVTILYTLNFTLIANYLYKKGRGNEQSFIFTIGKAAIFLSITIPIIFSGQVITTFWIAETAVLAWISEKLNNKKILYGSYFILFISLFKFFLIDYSEVFKVNDNLIIIDGYTFKVAERLFSSVFLLGAYYKFVDILRKSVFKNDFSLGVTGFGWVISLFIILNVEVSALFYTYAQNLRFVAISVLWAIFAITLMYFGLRFDNKYIRRISISLFGLTLAKVFFFDIAEMSASYKFVSFIILGIILIFASYLYRQFKQQIIETLENKDEETPKTENI
ncbi:MAG: DUF2339 domain-containing protein [Candidatus Sericytochromatia bacterium]